MIYLGSALACMPHSLACSLALALSVDNNIDWLCFSFPESKNLSVKKFVGNGPFCI